MDRGKCGYLLVVEISLHAILFVQVEAVVTVSIVLSKDSFDLSIGITTPANTIITECIYSVIIMLESVVYFANLHMILLRKIYTQRYHDKKRLKYKYLDRLW